MKINARPQVNSVTLSEEQQVIIVATRVENISSGSSGVENICIVFPRTTKHYSLFVILCEFNVHVLTMLYLQVLFVALNNNVSVNWTSFTI